MGPGQAATNEKKKSDLGPHCLQYTVGCIGKFKDETSDKSDEWRAKGYSLFSGAISLNRKQFGRNDH